MSKEKVVEQGIGKPAGDRDEKSLHGASVSDIEGVEEWEKGGGREKREQNAEIVQALRHHGRTGPEKPQGRFQKDSEEEGQQQAACRTGRRDQCEAACRAFLFSFSEVFGDECRSAGCQHDRQAENQIDGRVDDIGSRQSLCAGIAADKYAVSYCVERDDEHHADRGSGKAQQGKQAEPLRQRSHGFRSYHNKLSFRVLLLYPYLKGYSNCNVKGAMS